MHCLKKTVWAFNMYISILQTLKHISEESEKSLNVNKMQTSYHKSVKLECAIITVVWEDGLESFNKRRNSKSLFCMYLMVNFCYHLYFRLLKNS